VVQILEPVPAAVPRYDLTHESIDRLSDHKGEPDWVRKFRHKSLDIFLKKPMPNWLDEKKMATIVWDDINYFIRAADRPARRWEDVPEEIKSTYDRLGIPEAERKFLAGANLQYEGEAVYESLKDKWTKQGIIFCDIDSAIRRYPDVVKKYLGTLVPPADNKFAALNSAYFSGGSFIIVPAGIKVEEPLQAFFYIQSKSSGQFERTLIIVEEGANCNYAEGCGSPTYKQESLHAAVVEVFVHKRARMQYTTIQNWSKNVLNMTTKRAIAYEDAHMSWTDYNGGSSMTVKYPAVYLAGEGAHGEVLSLAHASADQLQDTGGKIVHMASRTTSQMTSKSISAKGGRATFRGLIKVAPGLTGCKITSKCDALILDAESASDTIPYIEVESPDVVMEHEATVSKISEDQLFYLQSRGISEDDAKRMIVNGFIEPIVKTLPMEYAVELNRLVEMEMEGSVG